MVTASLLDILLDLQNVESAVSDYYAACALQWEQDRTFWAALVKDEMAHAQRLAQAAEMVRRRPSDFAPGSPFTKEAVLTLVSGIRENIEKVAHGDMTAENALHFARIVEEAIVGLRYHEVVKSANPAFLSLLEEIAGETDEHLMLISRKMTSPHPHPAN